MLYYGWIDYDAGGSVWIVGRGKEVVGKRLEAELGGKWCDDRFGPISGEGEEMIPKHFKVLEEILPDKEDYLIIHYPGDL